MLKQKDICHRKSGFTYNENENVRFSKANYGKEKANERQQMHH